MHGVNEGTALDKVNGAERGYGGSYGPCYTFLELWEEYWLCPVSILSDPSHALFICYGIADWGTSR